MALELLICQHFVRFIPLFPSLTAVCIAILGCCCSAYTCKSSPARCLGHPIHTYVLGLPLQVRELQSLTSINERCQELQRNKRNSSGRKTAALNPSFHTKGAATGDKLGSLANPKPHKGRAKSSDQGCPFLRVQDGEAGWERFKDAVLASPLDVEELARMGRSKQVRLSGAQAGLASLEALWDLPLGCMQHFILHGRFVAAVSTAAKHHAMI